MRLDHNPLHPGDRRRTYYKGEDFVRRECAHVNGLAFECMAHDKEAQVLICRSLKGS